MTALTSPTPIDTSTPRPLKLARMLAPETYTSEAWFQAELREVHYPAWHFACLASTLPESGRFITRRLLNRHVIVIKGQDGVIRAFLNSCRHRGAPLTLAACGTLDKLTCPFHQWTYNTQGELERAPGLGGLLSRNDIPRQSLNLQQLPCEVSHGLVFIHLDPDHTGSLSDFLGNYTSNVARHYRTERMVTVQEKSYSLNTNWKLYVEVDMETLHTNFVHQHSIGSQPVTPVEHSANWFGVFHRHSASPGLLPEKRHLAFPAPEDLSGPACSGTHFCVLLPGFFIVTAPEVMWWIQKTPISATQTQVDVGYAFHEETLERDDFDRIAPLYFQRLDQVIEEDDRITEYQLLGLHNGVRGHYTPVEPVVAHFAELMQQRMGQWIGCYEP
ncbi:MAG: aromatic ring-hydroxylating dioxygenase subunit alpha [Marinobacter sp.]|uniref:aromatic ring-hydroxylating oxygenase subunit alpha n=1 Tax=Marinobacter sp. TaxID=50741 RepID=UPI00299D5697|nr:aromatic ring-hydroxylating dioxygenase subunit alpha [Marinobacter sp.]MDX1756160.1 aromatic ring-hydroxylating dioxygenase subunit alpha [Marinobacter sp.]